MAVGKGPWFSGKVFTWHTEKPRSRPWHFHLKDVTVGNVIDSCLRSCQSDWTVLTLMSQRSDSVLGSFMYSSVSDCASRVHSNETLSMDRFRRDCC